MTAAGLGWTPADSGLLYLSLLSQWNKSVNRPPASVRLSDQLIVPIHQWKPWPVTDHALTRKRMLYFQLTGAKLRLVSLVKGLYNAWSRRVLLVNGPCG